MNYEPGGTQKRPKLRSQTIKHLNCRKSNYIYVISEDTFVDIHIIHFDVSYSNQDTKRTIAICQNRKKRQSI